MRACIGSGLFDSYGRLTVLVTSGNFEACTNITEFTRKLYDGLHT
jgi:hypothetical protein